MASLVLSSVEIVTSCGEFYVSNEAVTVLICIHRHSTFDVLNSLVGVGIRATTAAIVCTSS